MTKKMAGKARAAEPQVLTDESDAARARELRLNHALLGQDLEEDGPAGDGAWGYMDFNRAHYAEVAGRKEEKRIEVGIYHPDGGCTFEFCCVWVNVGSAEFKVELHGETMAALARHPEFLRELFGRAEEFADRRVFIEFLEMAGMLDLTQVHRDVEQRALIKDGLERLRAREEAREIAASAKPGRHSGKKSSL